MSAGTKVFLAVFAVLVAALVLYYATLGGDGGEALVVERAVDPLVAAADADTAGSDAATPARGGDRGAIRREQPDTRPPWGRPGGAPAGLLGESVARAADAARPPAADPPALSPAVVPPADPAEQPTLRLPTLAAGSRSAERPPVAGARPATTPPLVMGRGIPLAATAVKRSESPPAPKVVRGARPRPEGTKAGGAATTPYVVRAGDTMTSIAVSWFGDANRWSLIARANPLVDPDRLQIGDVLRLPARNATGAGPAPALRDASGRQSDVFVVGSGDTLSAIAERWYGDETRWREIYEANRGTIGRDPDRLTVGMKLTMPE